MNAYKTVCQLTKDQRDELRESVLCDLFEALGLGSPCWGELARAEDFITDDLMDRIHEFTSFTDDDFYCTTMYA